MAKRPTMIGVRYEAPGFTFHSLNKEPFRFSCLPAKTGPAHHLVHPEIEPRVCGGQPVIKGTRISIATILEQLADGESWDSLMNDYPDLTRADILAAPQ
jgi:uncharacterized protein (DUF433 family)